MVNEQNGQSRVRAIEPSPNREPPALGWRRCVAFARSLYQRTLVGIALRRSVLFPVRRLGSARTVRETFLSSAERRAVDCVPACRRAALSRALAGGRETLDGARLHGEKHIRESRAHASRKAETLGAILRSVRQYQNPPVLRVVRPRDPGRLADVTVRPMRLGSASSDAIDRDAITTRNGRLTPDPASDDCPETPRSLERSPSSEPYDASELIFESIEADTEAADRTPVTVNSPWQRGLPPPLPGGGS
jgi:hypothetical protein